MLATLWNGEAVGESLKVARNKLTVTAIIKPLEPGRYSDGDGLYLNVARGGSKSWIFMWVRDGKRREMGLGSFALGVAPVSLADARRKADGMRAILASGGDPIAAMTATKKAEVKVATFGEVADEFLTSMRDDWSNPKHAAQWKMTLTKYAKPIRSVPINAIEVDHVLTALKPHWQKRPETASRLRARIERVLDHASARKLRSGENPARWRGHLQNLLPAPKKLTRGHHKALPYPDVPAFLQRLKAVEGLAARALEVTILCATRSGETLNATWSEIDLQAAIWTIPAVRMKAKRDHRIPLSRAALEVLNALYSQRMSDFVFPGRVPRKPASGMAMAMVLRRMKVECTVHGFRSSFRDFCGEETSFPREVAEQALAHVVGDETERAYRRGDVLEKRRQLMEAWAAYLLPPPSTNVVKLHG
jgi:integrase